MTRLTIRWRLTLWYWLVLVLVVTSFALTVYWLMATASMNQANAEVVEELAEFRNQLESTATLSADDESLRKFVSVYQKFLFEAQTRDGRQLVFGAEPDAALVSQGMTIEGDEILLSTKNFEGRGRYRVGLQQIDDGGELAQIAIAIPLAPYDEVLHRFQRVLFVAGPIVLLAALAAGYFLACRALSPVEDLCRATERITAEILDERIEAPNPSDELGRLACTFNGMLQRLEQSFQELRVFTADAAHELRTPLAVLRSTLDVALRAERSPERYQEVLRDAAEDVERLCLLADRLLLLSQEDAGLTARSDVPVQIGQTLSGAIETMSAAASAHGVTIEATAFPDIIVRGDPDRLMQVWINLLDNAVKYCPAGTSVAVHVEPSGEQICVLFQDSGSGIPADEVERVFDRFYRVDRSRSSGTGGAGLGLAICKSIVTSHGGRISITPNSPTGTCVCVTLPVRKGEAT